MMDIKAPPSVASLYAASDPLASPLELKWRLIRRNCQPFLLVPVENAPASTALTLYTARGHREKIRRGLLAGLLRSPAADLFDRVSLQTQTSAEIVTFLAQQSGVPADKLHAPTIKLDAVESNRSQLVLLLGDESGHPLKVVKVGLGEAGRAATKREADIIENLPGSALGCIRLTGRMDTPNLSAFATDYFPGKSPDNDTGLERVFISWLSSAAPVAIESMDAWQDLETASDDSKSFSGAIAVLREAVAGKKVRSTLCHGDFVPSKVRSMDSQNLRVFGWENASMSGLPGWDWFHFIIQTAIIEQHPVERVAAEVEHLIQSPGFNQYAAEAGVEEIVRPLLLAYVVHQLYFDQPNGAVMAALYELLAERWGLHPARTHLASRINQNAGLFDALQTVLNQLANTFWAPRLSSEITPSLGTQFKRYWGLLALCLLILALSTSLQFRAEGPMRFMLFYLVPCLILTWFTDRRLGILSASVAACLGPLTRFVNLPEYEDPVMTLWNCLMRFMLFQTAVFLVDKLRHQKSCPFQNTTIPADPVKLSGALVVIATCALWLGAVFWLDRITPPEMSFLLLYLLPCMIITLTFDVRWGIMTSVLAITLLTINEVSTNPEADVKLAFHWNFCVRFLVGLIILLSLDQLKHKNVLYINWQQFCRLKPQRFGAD